MSFFKKKEKGEVDRSSWNDYEKAKYEYLEHISKTTATLHSWKLIAISCLAITTLAVGGMTYLSTRSSLIPYVIEVDELGNAKGINPAYQITYNPNEQNIEFYLREFVKNSRWVSMDMVLQGVFYRKSISLLGEEAANKFREIVRNENLEQMITDGLTRDVNIKSINKVSGTKSSYQITWEETVYHEGNVIDENKLVGIFAIKIEQPTTLEELENNPLGIKIVDYHITKEGA